MIEGALQDSEIAFIHLFKIQIHAPHDGVRLFNPKVQTPTVHLHDLEVLIEVY